MSTAIQHHWSGPNGCDDKCPACAVERKSRHTPGPWKVMADPERVGLHPLHENRFIATADALWDFDTLECGSLICALRDQPCQAADAALIAAAPDLLTALYATMACMEESHEHEIATNHDGDGPSCSYCRIMDRARAAIALATGGAK